MRASDAVVGIIFANVHDDLLGELTSVRSAASVPFAGRYRLIDFTLSNLVNAGVSNIGLLTKGNYRSLMDHIGSGVHWDLDRKKGGVHFLPPYSTGKAGLYQGSVEALYNATDFMQNSHAEYVIVCDANTAANVNLAAAIELLEKNEADAVLVCKNGKAPAHHDDAMIVSMDANNVVNKIDFETSADDVLFGLGITIIRRELLTDLVAKAKQNECENFYRDVLAAMVGKQKVLAFVHEGYAAVMDDVASYKENSFALLDPAVGGQLFRAERPVYTKTRDDMPTRYGTHSTAKNSLIADGCVIDGTVKNSILFRGVRVEKGAVVENSILMQGVCVGKDAVIDHVISDKNGKISAGITLKGTEEESILIAKNQTV